MSRTLMNALRPTEVDRIYPVLLVSTVLLGLCCSKDSGPPLFPATGRVLVDGAPGTGVNVRLHPIGDLGNLDALKPFGTTGDDGQFRLGTYRNDDGAPEGRYKVTLDWPDRPPAAGGAVDLLGGQYVDAAKSSFEVTVERGGSPFPTIEVMKKSTPSRTPARKAIPDNDGVS